MHVSLGEWKNWVGFREFIGRSGGILSIWNEEFFLASSYWHIEGVVVVNGTWIQEGVNCCLINIYALCPLADRISLWDRVQQVVRQNSSSCICIGEISIQYECNVREQEEELSRATMIFKLLMTSSPRPGSLTCHFTGGFLRGIDLMGRAKVGLIDF